MKREDEDIEEAWEPDDPPPTKRGNLVDFWLPDSDLWLLLTGRQEAPAVASADGRGISEHWITWAKLAVLDGRSIPGWNQRDSQAGFGRSEALTLYLCRLIRICDSMAPAATPSRKTAIELENLLLGAAEIARLEIDLCRSDAASGSGCDDVMRRACQSGMIQAEPADSRRSDLAGGNSGNVVYGLTLLGQRKADEYDSPPPYLWTREEAEKAAVTCDWMPKFKFPPGNPPAAPKRPDATASAQAKSIKTRRRGDWPVTRTQPEVARYLSERKAKYDELVPQCLRGAKEAHKEFKKFFGSTAIARALADGCYAQAVCNTQTYKEQIQPVLHSRPPRDWKPVDQGDSPFADDIANMRRQATSRE